MIGVKFLHPHLELAYQNYFKKLVSFFITITVLNFGYISTWLACGILYNTCILIFVHDAMRRRNAAVLLVI